jgi:hypothetical protein
MSRTDAYDSADCDWRVEFIQPAIPGDDRCIMLYGREGEIVGPLTMQLAEAWIDHFDSARYGTMLHERLGTVSS